MNNQPPRTTIEPGKTSYGYADSEVKPSETTPKKSPTKRSHVPVADYFNYNFERTTAEVKRLLKLPTS